MATKVPSVMELLSEDGKFFKGSSDKTINERLKQAQTKGDEQEVSRLNTAAGITSALTGIVTGLPDLAIMGINWGFETNIKDIRTRLLEASDIPTTGTEGDELTYNLPEYVAMALSLGQLAKQGIKKGSSVLRDKRLKAALKEVPPAVANKFQKFMVTGQGSNDPEIAFVLQQLRTNPKYAELFHKLDEAATKETIKILSPKPSSQTTEEAARGMSSAVSNKLNDLKKARSAAGELNFTRALAEVGDKNIIGTNVTNTNLNNLKVQFLDEGTPEAANAVRYINSLQENISGGFDPKINVSKLKALMSRFGKKASQGDSMINQLTTTDQKRINSAVFGGLNDDLGNSLKTATDIKDKKALGNLISARTQYKNASDEYDAFISKGIPKYLQDKSLNDVSFDNLYGEYTKLNKEQRTLFRGWVGDTKAESLKAIDEKVANDFLSKAFGELDDGTEGYKLGTMADNWSRLQKADKNTADMVAKSFGSNASEFTSRMKDAQVFTRRMQVGKAPEELNPVLAAAKRELPVTVGAIAGYAPAKATQLTLDIGEQLFKKRGLTDDQWMKALLRPEAAGVLKQSALTPKGSKVLEELTKVEGLFVTPQAKFTSASSTANVMTPREGAAPSSVEDVIIDQDTLNSLDMPSEQTGDDIVIDEDTLNSL
tara:strand:+ start:168 stop:2138 length:1971 start_codon:yes stop_codon:yes gene_type:complete